MNTSQLHGNLLFLISHCTETVVADLESKPMDSIQRALCTSLKGTIDHMTPFSIYSQIADTLIRRLEESDARVNIRFLEIIQRIIALDPRKETIQK